MSIKWTIMLAHILTNLSTITYVNLKYEMIFFFFVCYMLIETNESLIAIS